MKSSTNRALVAKKQIFTKSNRLTAMGKRIAIVLTLLLTLGIGQAWGGYNVHWKGNVFFRVPDNWDITTYSTIQIAVSRTTSATTSNYIEYLGKMTRVGTTRLYYIWVENNHSSWNQTEYVFFTANNSTYGSGTFSINNNQYYTTPINYDFTNSEYPYLYNPKSESNAASVTGSYMSSGSSYNDRRYALLHKEQKINLYTNGNASNTGGSVKITGVYLTGNTSTASSDVTSFSSSVAYASAIGSTVTLTATSSTGYQFDGWYTAVSGGNAVSTSTTYTYTCIGEKTLYARFSAKTYTVTLNNQGATTAGQASVTATYNAAMPSIANNLPEKTGYTFNGYFDATSGGTQYYKADGTSARTWNKTANTTLYAQWTQITYTVKWVVDGQEQATETVTHGSKPTQAPAMDPNDPICGEKFVGWVTAPIEGQLKDASTLTIYEAANLPEITGETTFYAVFADYEK